MKKIILSIVTLVAFTFVVDAQVGIETADVGASALLDFPDNATKGILLPRTNGTGAAGTAAGTFVFDYTTDEVKYYHEDDGWTVMTEAIISEDIDIEGHDLATYPELSSVGTKLEDGTSGGAAPDGVLSLESMGRALALPKVNGIENLPSPQPGMVCYDVSRKSMAIFNGEIWTFWN